MAQLSRPYQIALAVAAAALGMFAVWSLALHHPGSEPGSGPGSSPSSPAASAPAAHAAPTASSPTAASSNSAAGAPGEATPVYHGAAPGVEGLTRAIDKAHGAVATSEQNARQLQEKSAQASQEAPSTASAPSASAPAAVAHAAPHKPGAVHVSASEAAALAKASHRVVRHMSAAQLAALAQAVQQAQLKQELAQGKTVLLLFWNPKSSDDVEVRKQMQAVAASLKGKVAAHVALAGQVGLYGSVTRDVQIYQTPTLLIVGKKGLAVTLTGLVDRYAIEQGILEAKKASGKA